MYCIEAILRASTAMSLCLRTFSSSRIRDEHFKNDTSHQFLHNQICK